MFQSRAWTFYIQVRTAYTALQTFHKAVEVVHYAVEGVHSAAGAVRIAVKMAHGAVGTVRGALRETVDGLDSGRSESVCFHQEDTMTRSECEERRRALEAQRQADVALINAAHETRIRSLDRLWQATAEDDAVLALPAAVETRALPAVSAPPAAPDRKMRERGEVQGDLEAAFSQLPEVFDKRDVTRILGYEPARSTLFRTLQRLMNAGLLAMEAHSLPGTTLQAFRKIPPAG